jgi:hypothetical protein
VLLGSLDLTQKLVGHSSFVPGGRGYGLGFVGPRYPARWHDFKGTDSDGTRFTFRVRDGSGSVYVTPDGYDIDVNDYRDLLAPDVAGKPPKVTLSVRGGGDARVRLRNVFVHGPLASFSARGTDLYGTFSVSSSAAAPSIVLGSMTGSPAAPATLASAGTIRSISLMGPATHARVLAGAYLGSDGLFGGSDTAADLFASASILSLRVRAPVAASLFAAGLDPLNGIFLDGDDRVIGAGLSTIGSVIASQGVDSTSRFVASAFGTIRLPKRIDPASDARILSL